MFRGEKNVDLVFHFLNRLDDDDWGNLSHSKTKQHQWHLPPMDIFGAPGKSHTAGPKHSRKLKKSKEKKSIEKASTTEEK